ncbi:MAG: hypothetical protein GY822_17495 [Deltaproteobacteria bacterium]|nr:hypothetical protein [Deltaproteobacteria bacterium]
MLQVIFLVFNEGYAASSGASLIRRDLYEQALHFSKVVCALLPDFPEATGLLALMLLIDSRQEARIDDDENLVLLESQDRSRWQKDKMEQGKSLLQHALHKKKDGAFSDSSSDSSGAC